MHGIIFLELKKYVVTKFEDDAWSELLQEADLNERFYGATQV